MDIIAIWKGLDPQVQSGVGAIVVAVILALGNRMFAPKSKIKWAISHRHYFHLVEQQNDVWLNTQEIWIQNVGRAPADNIRLCLSHEPKHIEFWQPNEIIKSTTSDGHPLYTIKKLSPKEFITVHMIMIRENMPPVVFVKSDDGVGKEISMGPIQIYPASVRNTLVGFMFLGMFSFIYLAIRLAIFLI